MEALAAFGLTASVLTATTFIKDAIELVKDIHHHGSPCNIRNLSTVSEQIARSLEDLQTHHEELTKRNVPLNKIEAQLQGNSESCTETVDSLRRDLAKLHLDQGRDSFGAIRKSAKILLRRRGLEDIAGMVTEWQRILTMTLTLGLRSVSSNFRL